LRVKVRFHVRLREITGKKEEFLNLREGRTIEDALSTLSNKYGERFNRYVYGQVEQIAAHLQILLNGDNMSNLQGLKTVITEGAQLDIAPLVAGG
jgi:MoaD family protein